MRSPWPAPRSGPPSSGPGSRPTSTTWCWPSRSRAAGSSPATSPSSWACRPCPAWPTTATARPGSAPCRSRRLDHGRHGLGGPGRGHREPLHHAVAMKRLTKGGEPWMSPSHTPTPEAPAFDMSITVGENTARLAGHQPGGQRRVGPALAPPRHRSSRQRLVRRRGRAGRSCPTAAPSPRSTSTPGPAPPWRGWPPCRRSTPRSTGPPSPPATRPGSTTPPPR